jgi:hypothetical protein
MLKAFETEGNTGRDGRKIPTSFVDLIGTSMGSSIPRIGENAPKGSKLSCDEQSLRNSAIKEHPEGDES